jgi:flagellin-like protein
MSVIFSEKNTKGISPLIAAVLLIAFTMTVAAILATWAQTFGQERLETAEQRGEAVIRCSALSMRVDSATYSGNSVQAVVWNTGDENMTNIEFVIYNSTSPSIPTRFQLNDANVTISPGNFKVLETDDVAQTPSKLAIHAQANECPKVQPLYTCQYTNGRFIC